MYSYSGSILRLGLAENRDTWGWTAEFAAPVLLGLPSKAIGTGPQEGALGFGGTYFTANNSRQNTAMIFPKQFYLRFNARGRQQGAQATARQVRVLGRQRSCACECHARRIEA